MKTYLFDFDGTLVDSMPAFIAGVLKELDKNNCKYGNDIVKTITPLGLAGTADYFIQNFGLKQSGGSDFHGNIKPGVNLGVGKGNLEISDKVYYNLLHYYEKMI